MRSAGRTPTMITRSSAALSRRHNGIRTRGSNMNIDDAVMFYRYFLKAEHQRATTARAAEAPGRQAPLLPVFFLVVEYRSPSLGRVFAAYTGGESPLSFDAYANLYYANESGGSLRIVARYMPDFYADPREVAWE